MIRQLEAFPFQNFFHKEVGISSQSLFSPRIPNQILQSQNKAFIPSHSKIRNLSIELDEAILKDDISAATSILRLSSVLQREGIITLGSSHLLKAVMEHPYDPLMIRLLISFGFDVNGRYANRSPVMEAVEKGDLALVAFLHNLGADLNQPSLEGGVTPLELAFELSDFMMIRFLLKCNATIGGRISERLKRAPFHLKSDSAIIQFCSDPKAVTTYLIQIFDDDRVDFDKKAQIAMCEGALHKLALLCMLSCPFKPSISLAYAFEWNNPLAVSLLLSKIGSEEVELDDVLIYISPSTSDQMMKVLLNHPFPLISSEAFLTISSKALYQIILKA